MVYNAHCTLSKVENEGLRSFSLLLLGALLFSFPVPRGNYSQGPEARVSPRRAGFVREPLDGVEKLINNLVIM